MFTIPFAYAHPQVDSVPTTLQVDAVGLGKHEQITTLDQAVDLYLVAYGQQFASQWGAVRKRQRLQRFLTYLKAHQHTPQLSDLAYRDGQAFLQSLSHRDDGIPISRSTKEDYKGVLRTFSRFLAKSQLIPEDIFFPLKVV